MLFVCWFSLINLIILLLLICFKIYIKTTTGIYHGNERLDGKTVIITGASAGIGAETAKNLAGRGARIIMLCRDTVKGEKVRQSIIACTGNKDIAIKYVDFTSFASVRKCANEILSEESRIDVLVNNAGAITLDFHQVTEDGLNILMQTNHFGCFLFTNILLGKIKQSASCRIVNVAAYIHRFAKLDLDDLEQKNVTHHDRIYANTKMANIYFTIVLAEKFKGTGVTVNCLHPGFILTEITRTYTKIKQIFNYLLLSTFFKNPWEGAQTTIYLCVSPSVANITGKYFSDCHETTPTRAAQDYNKARKLWELSEKAVKLLESEKHY